MIPHVLILLLALNVGEDRLDVVTAEFVSHEHCDRAGEAAVRRWTQEKPGASGRIVKLELGYLCVEK